MTSEALSIILAILLVSSLVILVMTINSSQKTLLEQGRNYQSLLSQQQEEATKSYLALVSLSSKGQDLVAAADPIAYQQIRAMEPSSGYSDSYDPSDTGESTRIAQRSAGLVEEEPNGFERGVLQDLIGDGIDPEFFAN